MTSLLEFSPITVLLLAFDFPVWVRPGWDPIAPWVR